MRGFVKSLIGAVALGVVAAAPAGAQQVNWSGLYLGGHVGWASSDVKWSFEQTGFQTESLSHSLDSVIGGGQVGLQHQFGNWVAGIELSGSGGKDMESVVQSTLFADRSRRADVGWLLMATARLGYAFDRSLLYFKGGYAGADVEITNFVTSTNVVAGHSNKFQNGWTVGAGLEYALSQGVNLGIEYNYVSLDGGLRTGVQLPGFANANHNVGDTTIHAVTARINFLLGRTESRAAPLK